MPRATRTARPILVGMAALALLAAGCQPETKVIRSRRLLAGVAGAETDTPNTGLAVSSTSQFFNAVPPNEVEMDEPVLVDEDGNRTLLSRTTRHLMYHIATTLREDDRELFAEQVLGGITKREFEARGLNPEQAFDMLKPYQRDIFLLFQRIPLGDKTPRATFGRVGARVWRISLPSELTRGLRFKFMDVELEQGQWKLRWFGPWDENAG